MHQTFSCFMVRSSLFEKAGYFDEMFWPAYFEDNDFHRRMGIAGVTETIAPCGYDHMNSATMKKYTKDELELHHERFLACRAYYVSKWGGMPGAERFTVPFDGKPESSLSF
jgi:GT2 family glycosyltransferase